MLRSSTSTLLGLILAIACGSEELAGPKSHDTGGSAGSGGGTSGRSATGGTSGSNAGESCGGTNGDAGERGGLTGGAAGETGAGGSGGEAGESDTGAGGAAQSYRLTGAAIAVLTPADGGATGEGSGGAGAGEAGAGGSGELPRIDRVECSILIDLVDVVEEDDGFSAVAVGEVFRNIYSGERRWEFSAFIGGPATLTVVDDDAIEVRAVGDQTGAKPFWQAIEVLEGTPTASGAYLGEWTCATLALNDPGFPDVEGEAPGTWELTRLQE